MKLSPLDLVRLRLECRSDYKGILPIHEQFVFLGEITQMPGHGVFAMLGTGKIYAGFHMYSFELVPQET